MDFREFTNRLALGELSNLSVTDENDKSEIRVSDRASIMFHLNRGLVNLFTRFMLLEKDVLIRVSAGTTNYFLRKEFAVSNQEDVPIKYIIDTVASPFKEDVIKITEVFNSVGVALPVDQEDEPYSLYLPEYDCLQIPNIYDGEFYSVVYQAKHPNITGIDSGQEIHVPLIFEEALQYYVAAKIFTNMNGQDNTAKGSEYMTQYLSICQEAELKDSARTAAVGLDRKLDIRGFQ